MRSMNFVAPLLFCALTPSLPACDRADGVRGSGNEKTEPRSVSGFSRIVLASSGDVTISQTGAESLTVTADDNLLPHLRTAVSGGTLKLDTDTAIKSGKPIKYAITVKDLSSLEVSGAGDLTATGVHAGTLRVAISGEGDVKLTGDVEREEVTVSGAGDYEGARLTAKTAKVVVSGAGNASVTVSDALDVDIGGAGNVVYAGDAKVTSHVSGAGSVHKR
jgi:hypothetical protein